MGIEYEQVTKRMILSVAQQVFDPIGFLCPTILVPKIMLQKLWKENLTWDQLVDEVVAKSFKYWVKALPYVINIKIPRWILIGDNAAEEVTVHTFCDASQDAYACAVFVRVKLHRNVSVFWLAAKSRVAPLKKSGSKMTVPRLELLAGTIGARLYTNVAANLSQKYRCFFWSDSTTVISWIQRKEEWGVFPHLPGIQNPADLPSRGNSPNQLLDSKWWEGPLWLYELEEDWPAGNVTCDEEEVYAGRKKKLVTTLINVDGTSFWNIDYFSKSAKTIRMMAYLLRFIHNTRHPIDKRVGELSLEELEVAENFVFKVVQKETFTGVNAPRIASLSPFVMKKA
ncbi:uncharacterized protein LOC126738773 [Anthonomus grandis grandis]|uniref:uncharacterized protein LOC126738773 n=1 Tax=Anthonomus grandis grandis TaxID=2921223 RepID=UPI0021663AEA|nr:uncharacterized protein LOC126738773 [Anthonomus grandis grandis]